MITEKKSLLLKYKFLQHNREQLFFFPSSANSAKKTHNTDFTNQTPKIFYVKWAL